MKRGILGNLALVLRGPWQPDAEYRKNDVVRYGGALWGALDRTGERPGQGPGWMLLLEGGAPLLTLVWDTSGLPEPGFLDISQDHGLLARAEFPEAWAKIELMTAAGRPNVLADGAWLAESAANGGVCGKYSTGDGADTFRVPLIRRRFLRAADDGLPIGTAQGDAIRNITGMLGSYGKYGGPAVTESPTSALFSTLLDLSSYDGGGGAWSRWFATLDASRAVPTAEENRPVAMAFAPLLKVA